MLSWQELEEKCQSCTACPLCETRHNVVFGVGDRGADLMFVGEGPGEQEDLRGEPFVGPAGQLLDDMLSIIDVDRTNCYIANIVKCRPPRNRDPQEPEQEACIDPAIDRPKLSYHSKPRPVGSAKRRLVYRHLSPFRTPP